MYHQAPLNLNLSRKLLLGAAGLVTIASPLVYGVIRPTPTVAHLQTSNVSTFPAFKSVSILRTSQAVQG